MNLCFIDDMSEKVGNYCKMLLDKKSRSVYCPCINLSQAVPIIPLSYCGLENMKNEIEE